MYVHYVLTCMYMYIMGAVTINSHSCHKFTQHTTSKRECKQVYKKYVGTKDHNKNRLERLIICS